MTDESNDRIVIEGVDNGGHKFRPSDWAERVAANLASYDEDRRLCYSKDVSPCTIKGIRCLVVAVDMAQQNPEGYRFIMRFADDNHLRIQLDRRSQRVEVETERRA